MSRILVRDARVVNEGRSYVGHVLVHDGVIMDTDASRHAAADEVVEAAGLVLMPGIIDDQVHFREPGLTHKATIGSEARAAVAGGVTTYMEMPNTKPPATTQALLQQKYDIAAATSVANYSFFMGTTNDNLSEVLQTDARTVCGVKVFMGSSTGNMLVDRPDTLEQLFAQVPLLIATHCEDEATVRANEARARAEYGEEVPIGMHEHIRSVEACYRSSAMARELALRYGTRLHILHISTADELELFSNELPLSQKRITSEVCVHHLYFSALDYATLGTGIKCNPAIKAPHHREALWQALLDNRLDIVATDHAPHTREEKEQRYFGAPSGVPLIQHSLNMMLEGYHEGRISLERIVEKMCHAPAVCFQVDRRGFIREGYHADLVLLDPEEPWQVRADNVLYRCGWSPFEGHTFRGRVHKTWVNGQLAYAQGLVNDMVRGQRVLFNR